MTQTSTKPLSARQQKALTTLLTYPTIEKAAAAVDIHPRTIKRWLAEDEAFVEAYREVRQAAVDGAIAQLQAGMSEAVETLRANLKARNDSVQVRAAVSLLDLAFRATERAEVEARIEELERAAGVHAGKSGRW